MKYSRWAGAVSAEFSQAQAINYYTLTEKPLRVMELTSVDTKTDRAINDQAILALAAFKTL